MADDSTKRGTQDRTRINLTQDHEVRYWTKRLGVTEEQLKAAVKEHGPVASKVEEALKKPG